MVLGRRELSAAFLAVAAIVVYMVLLSTTPSGAQINGTTLPTNGITTTPPPPVDNFITDEFDENINITEQIDENIDDQIGVTVRDPVNQTPKPRKEPSNVVNVPNRPLPPSGGLPVYAMVAGSVLTGAGLLALGLVIRRGSRG